MPSFSVLLHPACCPISVRVLMWNRTRTARYCWTRCGRARRPSCCRARRSSAGACGLDRNPGLRCVALCSVPSSARRMHLACRAVVLLLVPACVRDDLFLWRPTAERHTAISRSQLSHSGSIPCSIVFLYSMQRERGAGHGRGPHRGHPKAARLPRARRRYALVFCCSALLAFLCTLCGFPPFGWSLLDCRPLVLLFCSSPHSELLA